MQKNGVIQHLGDIVPGDRVKIERGRSKLHCTVDQIKDDQRAGLDRHLTIKQKVKSL